MPSLDEVREISLLEPFGEQNPEPRFLLKNQEINQKRQVGAERTHLQCRIGNAKGIGFGLGSLLPSLPNKVDVVCRVGVNTWGGSEQVQLFVEDLATTTPVQSSQEDVETSYSRHSR